MEDDDNKLDIIGNYIEKVIEPAYEDQQQMEHFNDTENHEQPHQQQSQAATFIQQAIKIKLEPTLTQITSDTDDEDLIETITID